MIQTLEREQYNLWDSFVLANNGSFLQISSWSAEKFFIVVETTQIDADKTRINADDIIGGCKVEERKLWLGKIVWIIRRPTIPKQELLNFLFEKAREQGNVVMIRTQDSRVTSYKLRVTRPKFLFHVEDPATTLMVDLSYSEDELMREMHEKTRYNIRLAEKKGVIVREGKLDEFYSLYEATNKRKGLKGFSKEYFEKLCHSVLDTESKQKNQKQKDLKSFGFLDPVSNHGMTNKVNVSIKVFTAYNEDVPLASNFLIGFGDTVTYLFGGTSDEHRESMAPHLLHWECMKWAKQNGYHWYDWWGIEDHGTRSMEHGTKLRNWEGITRFKKGFVHAPELRSVRDFVPTQRQDSISKYTGRVVEYGETVDVVINKIWYHLFAFIKRFV